MISCLTMRRRGSEFSTQFVVADRQVLYQSPVMLTPYVTDTMIDAGALQEFFEQSYKDADVRPDDIDTGAVVITGEALRRENAREIAALFCQWGGTFVCVSAGPHHEALMAAHGSGAVALSEREHSTVLNIDIGGGTTKLSLVADGGVLHTESFSVGARLVAVGQDGRIVRLEPAARRMLRDLGLGLAPGDVLDEQCRTRLAAMMADIVVGTITGEGTLEPLRRELSVTSPDEPRPHGRIEAIVVSGGVSEYLSRHDQSSYGDLGADLGSALRSRLLSTGWASRVVPAAQGIRATVVGASQYMVQASGQTSYISEGRVLPVRGLRAIKAALTSATEPAAVLRDALRRHDLAAFSPGLALALSFEDMFSYSELRRCAEAIATIAWTGDPGALLCLLVDADLAHSLGRILKDELCWPGSVVALDGIDVGELDFVDIGAPIGASSSLPVTVKSLVFPLPASS
jgi:ethanolamine utilization protein EutA